MGEGGCWRYETRGMKEARGRERKGVWRDEHWKKWRRGGARKCGRVHVDGEVKGLGEGSCWRYETRGMTEAQGRGRKGDGGK